MTFEVIVIVILIILLVNQFDLWNRFTVWFNQQAESDSIVNNRNYKGYIIIVLIGAIFAFITAYFQTARDIDFAATTLALEQLTMNNEVIAESAVNAQTVAFQNAFSFSTLYWNKFFENAALFIMLPILISLGTVFMHDEMKRTKEELSKVTIGGNNKDDIKEEVTETVVEPVIEEEPIKETVVLVDEESIEETTDIEE